MSNSPSPAFETAMQLSRDTGMDIADAAHQVEQEVPLLNGMKFETRIQAALRESKARMAEIEAEQAAADAKGELWTVQAALYPGRAFCIVYRGRVEDMEPLESQHQASGAFLGPVFLTGKQTAVMAEALALFCVNEVTIRVIKGTGIAA